MHPSKTISPPQYLTPKQAAAHIGMSVTWLLKRMKRNLGPPYRRRGGRIQILEEDLLKWDEQQTIP